MSAQKLYLFVGYPGAGKTTTSRLITSRTGATHLWADHERQVMFGKAHLDEAETTKLYEHLNDMTAQLLAEGKSVIFDTNFNFRKDRNYLRQLAQDYGAETVLIWLKTPIDIARQRATQTAEGRDTRVWGNMDPEDFQRISDNLEAPSESEQPVIFEGDSPNDQEIIERLGI